MLRGGLRFWAPWDCRMDRGAGRRVGGNGEESVEMPAAGHAARLSLSLVEDRKLWCWSKMLIRRAQGEWMADTGGPAVEANGLNSAFGELVSPACFGSLELYDQVTGSVSILAYNLAIPTEPQHDTAKP